MVDENGNAQATSSLLVGFAVAAAPPFTKLGRGVSADRRHCHSHHL
jgi:hypothetical protein